MVLNPGSSSAEDDVLAYKSFPADHWSKIHSTNGLERLNGEVKRRTEVVGIFPDEDAIVRLVGRTGPSDNVIANHNVGAFARASTDAGTRFFPRFK
jgi:hypothetical protein